MPHKMNTRSSERVNGLAVVVRGYVSMVGELAGDQWNEGDVSDSVVRRVALPSAFFATDGLFQTFLTVLDEFGAYPAVVVPSLDRFLPFLATTKILRLPRAAASAVETAHEVIGRARGGGGARDAREGPGGERPLRPAGGGWAAAAVPGRDRRAGGRPSLLHRRGSGPSRRWRRRSPPWSTPTPKPRVTTPRSCSCGPGERGIPGRRWATTTRSTGGGGGLSTGERLSTGSGLSGRADGVAGRVARSRASRAWRRRCGRSGGGRAEQSQGGPAEDAAWRAESPGARGVRRGAVGRGRTAPRDLSSPAGRRRPDRAAPPTGWGSRRRAHRPSRSCCRQVSPDRRSPG